MANWSARVTILTKFHDPSPPHPHAPTLPPAVAAMYHHPLSFQVQLFVFCFILFCFFKFNLGLLKSFLELSSSIVFIFSVWLAELDFCCKYMHFKFKEAMNRKRCQIKSILLYNSSIGGNIKVEIIDTCAWVLTVYTSCAILKSWFFEVYARGFRSLCLYNEKSSGIFSLSH